MSTLLSRRSCQGTLGYLGRLIPVTCTIECASDGDLHIVVDEFPLTRDNAWLLEAAYNDDGPQVRFFDLAVTTLEGETITSSNVYVTTVGTPLRPATGTRLHLEAGASTLNLIALDTTIQAVESQHCLRYRTVGMRGCGSVTGICDVGSVLVSGPTELEDYHELAGQIVFQHEIDDSVASEWISRCDRRALSILRMMSFALGRSITWSVREHFAAESLVSVQFVGPAHTAPPAEPVFHHLDLQPVLDVALANHERLLDPATGLGEAIDWVVQWYTLAELRFLAAATAFECLVARHAGESGSLLPKTVFNDEIRQRLQNTLSSPEIRASLGHTIDEGKVDAILNELQMKLGNLNQTSLVRRLSAFLTCYDVPLDDLPVPITKLLRMRNQVVHGGASSAVNFEDSVTAHADMIREALRRSVLAMVGFEGRFCSYLRGQEWLTFLAPPTRMV
jgi:hypothetical protein